MFGTKHQTTRRAAALAVFTVGVAAALCAAPARADTLLASAARPGGNTYQIWSAPQGLNWTQAEAKAVTLGGHLASIADAAENAFVYDLVDEFIATLYYPDPGNQLGPYIGAFRAVNGGPFAWSDGTPFVYTNWAAGEPSNYGGAENAIHLFANGTDPVDSAGEGAFWNDVGPNANGINNQLGYVVELAGGTVPEPGTWAMLLIGFAGVGATARRKRRGQIVAA